MRAGLILLFVAWFSLSACGSDDPTPAPGSPTPETSALETPSSPTPGSAQPSTPAPSTAGPASTPSETGGVVDPEDVPPDDTDYSQDIGNTPQQYEYEPELEPPDSVVATLCNLNQTFFTGLRNIEQGEAVADSMLRTSTVALDDLIDYWETLRAQYPDAGDEIDTGVAIQEQWKAALLSLENGDDRGAEKAMAQAERLIEELPESAAANCYE